MNGVFKYPCDNFPKRNFNGLSPSITELHNQIQEKQKKNKRI